MHSDYSVFDAHCDTLTVKNLFHTKTHLNYKHMKKYSGYTQVFAICADGKKAFNHALHHIKRYDLLTKRWGIEKIENAQSLKSARYGAILALEGADALGGSLSALRLFYNKGVRIITLTWNNDNNAASSITAENDRGLTPFGKRLVNECEKMGVAVDLSHIGDRGFFDVCDIATKPFICSHSNSRSVYQAAKRNITDAQFKKLIKHGGVCGINFYGEFLGADKNIDAVFSHIEHFCTLGGVKNIGIGSDFDGISYLPKDCSGASYMEKIAEILLKHNYSENSVKAILHDNFFNVMEKILK